MTRRYIKQKLRRRIAIYGRPYEFSEVTTEWKLHRYIVMKLGSRIADAYMNMVLYGEQPLIIMPRNNGRTALKKAFMKAWNNDE